MKNVWYYEYPIGCLGIACKNNKIYLIAFKGDKRFIGTEPLETPIIKETDKQLSEYFSGKRHEFSVPLDLIGTEFQKKVWNALISIPYGEKRSYKDIAILVENPKGCRAVGMANNRNPVMIIVPCHRIVGANGDLVGYAGGLSKKQYLLNLEKKD